MMGLGRLFSFLLRVVRGFMRNQGLLLSAAVAYYTLLSIVPLTILAIVVLSHVIDKQQLIHTLSTYLEMVIPGYAATLTEQVKAFLENREVIGFIGFLGMLFFSSTAFSMLESAMSVIFFHRVIRKRRHFFISALIPYAYIFLMGLGIVLVSFIVGTIETVESGYVTILDRSLNLGGNTGVALYILGIVGEVLMFTSFYWVMPVGRVRFSHSLLGGMTATVLWELTRRVLIWYYAAASMVNIIYGSIATTVVALLIIEVVAIILLLGAQVIAELERKPDEVPVEEHLEFKT
jgi:membrane protein